MLEPPGTMRTPCSAVEAASPGRWPCRSRAAAWRSIDMSTIAPKRKPSRMPFFTQALTRQPVWRRGIGLGGADRCRAFSAVLEIAERARK